MPPLKDDRRIAALKETLMQIQRATLKGETHTEQFKNRITTAINTVQKLEASEARKKREHLAAARGVRELRDEILDLHKIDKVAPAPK